MTSNSRQNSSAANEVRITGVIDEEITSPDSEGRYDVPLKLSCLPSPLWVMTFKQHWEGPHTWTAMGANTVQVNGDRVVIERTTIEEIKGSLKDTLKLAVQKANEVDQNDKREHAQMLERDAQQRMEREHQLSELRGHVKNMAKDIEFD